MWTITITVTVTMISVSIITVHTEGEDPYISKIQEIKRCKIDRTDREEEKGTNERKRWIKERKRKRRQSGQTFRE